MSERTTSVLPARISYADAKRLASDGDVKERRALAARGDVRPEILYFLAEDPVAEVRREIAVNDGAPRHADLVLARDADAAVREELAAKIARLTPELMPHIRGNLYKLTVQALEVLARDQVVRVRQLVAEALQDQANAPAGVISILARDDELAVCGPVLRYSPVLTDADLLAIIRSTTVQGALRAISHRDAVSGDVADAIAAAGDVAAVADLLGNDSAQVREETLDRIIEGAVDVPPWHAPLVRRPRLPVGAAIRLARFVAHSLLHELQNRADLDAQMVKAVAEIVDRRLTTESSEDDVGEDDVGEADGPAGAGIGRRQVRSRLGQVRADKRGRARAGPAGRGQARRGRRRRRAQGRRAPVGHCRHCRAGQGAGDRRLACHWYARRQEHAGARLAGRPQHRPGDPPAATARGRRPRCRHRCRRQPLPARRRRARMAARIHHRDGLTRGAPSLPLRPPFDRLRVRRSRGVARHCP